MVFNTVFNMVHTIGEFLCLKYVENILKKHFENFRMKSVMLLKTKFQHMLKSVMHFENYVSTCFEIFDMVFSMPFQHNGS